MKVVLVDCLIYRGLLRCQRRHAAASPDRDEPLTTRMKKAHYTITSLTTTAKPTSGQPIQA
jgi:hypothetical protein